MKKVTAILLLVLFGFNLVGYRFFFSWLQEKHKVSLEASINQNRYSVNDLIEVKVSLSLPYISSQSQFERFDGCITVQGKSYKYVKRKIENGHLVLLCLPDKTKMSLDRVENEFGSYANDLPANGHKNKESFKKWASITEFEETAKPVCVNHSFVVINSTNTSVTTSIHEGFLRYNDKPPQGFCS